MVSHAGEHEEKGEFSEAGLTERGREAELVGDVFEGEQECEDEAGGGFGGEVVEVAAEGLDAGGAPMGEVGEGAGLDLAMGAKAFRETRLNTDRRVG